jgi:hypothetical protein
MDTLETYQMPYKKFLRLDRVCRKSFLLFDRVVCGMLPNIGTEMSKKIEFKSWCSPILFKIIKNHLKVSKRLSPTRITCHRFSTKFC